MTKENPWHHIAIQGRKTFVNGELVSEMSEEEYNLFLEIMKRWFAPEEEADLDDI